MKLSPLKPFILILALVLFPGISAIAQLAGTWRDGDNFEIVITQNGGEVQATAKPEELRKWWDTGLGNVEGNRISLTHSKRGQITAKEMGTIDASGSLIKWDNGTQWKRLVAGPAVTQLGGTWQDGDNFDIVITQNGGDVQATAKPAELRQWWEIGKGNVNGNRISLTHSKGGQITAKEVGTIDASGSRIQWDNGTWWVKGAEIRPNPVPPSDNTVSPANLHPISDWMFRNRSEIQGKRLCDLAIPSSHDMGMYVIKSVYGQSINLNDIGNDANVFSPDAKPAIRAGNFLGPAFSEWCQTQEKDAYTQLVDGIRYFDVRVCVDGSGQLATCHSLYGASIASILEDVRRFCAEHPREIIILGLNHFWDREYQIANNLAVGENASEGLRNEKWNQLLNAIEGKLGDRLIPNSYNPTSTLNEFWSQPKGTHQIICNFDKTPTVPLRNWMWIDQEKGTWVGPIQDQSEFKTATLQKISERAENFKDKFWSIKTCITPDIDFYLKGTDPLSNTPYGLKKMADQTTPVVLGWIRDEWRSLPVNLVWSDFYNRSDLVKVCLDRNGIPVTYQNSIVGQPTSWKDWKWGYELAGAWFEQAGLDAVNWVDGAATDAADWFVQAAKDTENWADFLLNGEKVAPPAAGTTPPGLPDGVRHYTITLFHVSNWGSGSDGGDDVEIYGSINCIPKGKFAVNSGANQFLFNKRAGNKIILKDEGEKSHDSTTVRKQFYILDSDVELPTKKKIGSGIFAIEMMMPRTYVDIVSRLMEHDDFDNDQLYGGVTIDLSQLPVGYYKESELFVTGKNEGEKIRIHYAVSRIK